MTFELTAVTKVLLTNINIRREIHGDESVVAIDLAMQLEGANDLLDLFDPALRQALYFNAATIAGQEELHPAIAILPNLRFPKLNGCKFGLEKGDKYKGYRMVLDWGLGDTKSNVDLDDCVVTGKKIEVKEGGTVVIGWTVQYAGEKLTDEVRGKLTGLTQEKIFVQLLAPAVLQLVKGKPKKATDEADVDDEDLLDDGGEDTPELALERAHAGA